MASTDFNYDEMDLEPKNAVHDQNEDENAKKKELLSLTLTTDDGREGFAFTTEERNGVTLWNCHVCCYRSSWKGVLMHISSARHLDIVKKYTHPTANFTKFTDVLVPQFISGEPLPPGMEDTSTMSTICCINETLNKLTKPLIGVELLVEIVEDKYSERRYECMLCLKRGDPRTIITHLTSIAHYTYYLRKFFPKLYASVSKLPKSNECKPKVSAVISHLIGKIEERYGRLNAQVVTADVLKEQRSAIGRMLFNNTHITETPEDADLEEMLSIEYVENPELLHQNFPLKIKNSQSDEISLESSQPSETGFHRSTVSHKQFRNREEFDNSENENDPKKKESENLSSVSEILNSKEISDIKRRSVTPGDGNNEPKPMSSSSCYDNYKYDRYHFNKFERNNERLSSPKRRQSPGRYYRKWSPGRSSPRRSSRRPTRYLPRYSPRRSSKHSPSRYSPSGYSPRRLPKYSSRRSSSRHSPRRSSKYSPRRSSSRHSARHSPRYSSKRSSSKHSPRRSPSRSSSRHSPYFSPKYSPRRSSSGHSPHRSLIYSPRNSRGSVDRYRFRSYSPLKTGNLSRSVVSPARSKSRSPSESYSKKDRSPLERRAIIPSDCSPAKQQPHKKPLLELPQQQQQQLHHHQVTAIMPSPYSSTSGLESIPIPHELDARIQFYNKHPEQHPEYNEEWKKFWNKRYKEIQSKGSHNPANYDYRPEWIEHWAVHMKKLFDDEIFKYRMEITAKRDMDKERQNRDQQSVEVIDLDDIDDDNPPNLINNKRDNESSISRVDSSNSAADKNKVTVTDIKNTWKALTGSDMNEPRQCDKGNDDDGNDKETAKLSRVESSKKRKRSLSRNSNINRGRRANSNSSSSSSNSSGSSSSSSSTGSSKTSIGSSKNGDRKRRRSAGAGKYRHGGRRRHRSRSKSRSRSRQTRSKSRSRSRQSRSKSHSVSKRRRMMHQVRFDNPLNVITVLRQLCVLDEQLGGNLAKHVIALLSAGLAMETRKPGSSIDVLTNDNILFLEMCKEKLKGQFLAGIVPKTLAKTHIFTIRNIEDLLDVTLKLRKLSPPRIPKPPVVDYEYDPLKSAAAAAPTSSHTPSDYSGYSAAYYSQFYSAYSSNSAYQVGSSSSSSHYKATRDHHKEDSLRGSRDDPSLPSSRGKQDRLYNNKQDHHRSSKAYPPPVSRKGENRSSRSTNEYRESSKKDKSSDSRSSKEINATEKLNRNDVATSSSPPPPPVIDKLIIAQQIAAALTAEGRTDVSQAELEGLINVVVQQVAATDADNKKNSDDDDTKEKTTQNIINEPISSYDLDDISADEEEDANQNENSSFRQLDVSPDGGGGGGGGLLFSNELSDKDLINLSRNFDGLTEDEQVGLIRFVKKLFETDPVRAEGLKSYTNKFMPADRNNVSQTPLTSILKDSSSKTEMVVENEDDENYTLDDVCKAAVRNVLHDAEVKAQEERRMNMIPFLGKGDIAENNHQKLQTATTDNLETIDDVTRREEPVTGSYDQNSTTVDAAPTTVAHITTVDTTTTTTRLPLLDYPPSIARNPEKTLETGENAATTTCPPFLLDYPSTTADLAVGGQFYQRQAHASAAAANLPNTRMQRSSFPQTSKDYHQYEDVAQRRFDNTSSTDNRYVPVSDSSRAAAGSNYPPYNLYDTPPMLRGGGDISRTNIIGNASSSSDGFLSSSQQRYYRGGGVLQQQQGDREENKEVADKPLKKPLLPIPILKNQKPGPTRYNKY